MRNVGPQPQKGKGVTVGQRVSLTRRETSVSQKDFPHSGTESLLD